MFINPQFLNSVSNGQRCSKVNEKEKQVPMVIQQTISASGLIFSRQKKVMGITKMKKKKRNSFCVANHNIIFTIILCFRFEQRQTRGEINESEQAMLQEPIQLTRLFLLMFNECWEISLQDFIFASLISLSKIILLKRKYRTFDTVFYHKIKHPEVHLKYSAFFNSSLSVSSCDETLSYICEIT